MGNENVCSRTERLAEFLENFGERAYWIAFRLCRNQDEAKDLVQETCYRALRRWDNYDPMRSFESWFLVVLRHEFIDRRRSPRWRSRSLDFVVKTDYGPMPFQEILTSSEKPILEMLVHEETRGLVRKTFKALRPKDRKVLALCDIDGLQYDAVAEKIGVPTGTARSRIYRARQRLRAALIKRDPEISMCSNTNGV